MRYIKSIIITIILKKKKDFRDTLDRHCYTNVQYFPIVLNRSVESHFIVKSCTGIQTNHII